MGEIFRRIITPLERMLREYDLRDIKIDCERKNLEYYAEELRKLPPFAREVNNYIEEKAKSDLPIEQFKKRLSFDEPQKWVEIAGFLGYNGNLEEIDYVGPNPDKVRIIKDDDGNVFGGIFGPSKRINPEPFKDKFDYIIDWHTHPVELGEMSLNDVVNGVNINAKVLGEDKVYFVVYAPAIKKSVWYQAKKFENQT